MSLRQRCDRSSPLKGSTPTRLRCAPWESSSYCHRASKKLFADVEEATKNYDKFILNVAVAYGGREGDCRGVPALSKIGVGGR